MFADVARVHRQRPPPLLGYKYMLWCCALLRGLFALRPPVDPSSLIHQSPPFHAVPPMYHAFLWRPDRPPSVADDGPVVFQWMLAHQLVVDVAFAPHPSNHSRDLAISPSPDFRL